MAFGEDGSLIHLVFNTDHGGSALYVRYILQSPFVTISLHQGPVRIRVIRNKCKSRGFCIKIVWARGCMAKGMMMCTEDSGILKGKAGLLQLIQRCWTISSARAWLLRDIFHPLEHLVTAHRPSALVMGMAQN